MVALAVAILVVFIGGLYFITHNKPDETPMLPTHGTRPGNGLPPKPEERWRYIKELENRQIGVKTPTEPTAGGEVNSKTQLTDEQRQLLEQMQADMQQRPTQLSEVPYNDPSQLRNGGQPQQVQQPAQQQIAPPVQQQQVTQPRNPFNNGTAPVQQPKPQVQQPKPQAVAPPVQTRQPEVKQEVKTEAAKPESKPESKQKWMVQCGSFRAADQAESVRAQLAFEGVESRVTAGGGWNRVMLGPYSSRAAADKTLSRLKGIGMSSCIPLSVGG
ncbi:Cell division protein FtsN [Serratia fonticola AU-P3(3)]|nr:Cell division protein FtsN [Serratia fonticola AU-P3(3)]